jgi:hypothetical protein
MGRDASRVERGERVVGGVDGELTEQRRLAIIRELKEEHPGVDIESTLAGALAGPASEDRPSVPVWEYPDYVAAHPEVSLEDLVEARFPITYPTGERGVGSIAEYLHRIPGRTPVYLVEPVDVIELFRLEHEAGMLDWDPETRGLRMLRPARTSPEVYETWRKTLRRWSDSDQPSGST